jgi:hypothetical protein
MRRAVWAKDGCWLDHHATWEIDAPGPRLTPACGGRRRRPRTEEWPCQTTTRSRCELLELLTRAARLQKRVWQQGRAAGQALGPAQPPQNRTCRFPRIRLKHRPAHTRSPAGGVWDGTNGGRQRRSVAGRRTTMLALPLYSRSGSKTALQAAHAELGYLESLRFSTNSYDYMLLTH